MIVVESIRVGRRNTARFTRPPSGPAYRDRMERQWTVEDHLRDAAPEHVALYREVEALILGQGEVTVSVSKTTITFKGRRRGFAGARPTAKGVQGYLDLMRPLPLERRITRVSPYTSRLFVHQYVLRSPDDVDATFAGWVREAFRVGEGDHLLGP
jgi:hypothetical protein